jgi:hypothetical protein
MVGHRRELNSGEQRVLRLIQQIYGVQNDADAVFITDDGAAAIFVTDKHGAVPIFANLTNLSAWRADGTIESETELVERWLRPGM